MRDVSSRHAVQIGAICPLDEVGRGFTWSSIPSPQRWCFIRKFRPLGSLDDLQLGEKCLDVRGDSFVGIGACEFVDLCESFGKRSRSGQVSCNVVIDIAIQSNTLTSDSNNSRICDV